MTGHYPGRVPPFGNPGIKARVQLPPAYRSLPRPSSPACTKASTLRPYCLIPSLRWGSRRDENRGRMTGQLEAKRPTDRRLVTSRRLQHTTTHSLTPSCQKATSAADWRQPKSLAEETYTVNIRMVPSLCRPGPGGVTFASYTRGRRRRFAPSRDAIRDTRMVPRANHGQLMTMSCVWLAPTAPLPEEVTLTDSPSCRASKSAAVMVTVCV